MGISERREREKEQRREALIDAAEKIIFAKGLDAATMDEIAEVAEFSKGTLYLYFKNKQDLYLAIHARGTRILRQLFVEAAAKHTKGIDKATAIGYAYYDFSRTYPDYYHALVYYESHVFTITDNASFARACADEGALALKVLADAIETGIGDKSIRPDLDPFKTAIILWGQSMGTIQLQSLKSELMGDMYSIDFEELVRLSFNMMTQSLKNIP